MILPFMLAAVLQASSPARDARHDFDFESGRWTIDVRRLALRTYRSRSAARRRVQQWKRRYHTQWFSHRTSLFGGRREDVGIECDSSIPAYLGREGHAAI